MTPQAPAIELEGARRTFLPRKRGGQPIRAVDGVTLAVEPGEVVGLLGHNGAGKTTLVRLIAGLLSPTAGTVRVGGLDPMARGVEVRRTLGVLPTSSILDVRLTARRNLEFTAELFDVSRDGLDERISLLLKDFGLEERADDKVEGFSAGMRQRLALARVLLPDPSLLLLDEPSAALDPLAVKLVRELIARMSRESGRTVVICTHDLAEAQAICDRVVVLDHGRIVTAGSPAQLAAGLARGLVEVELARADVARAHAVLAPEVREVSEHDGPLGYDTALLRAGPTQRADVPGVLRRLVDAGVAVFAVRPYEPTLEEVYLALYDGRTGESSGGAGDSDSAGAGAEAGADEGAG